MIKRKQTELKCNILQRYLRNDTYIRLIPLFYIYLSQHLNGIQAFYSISEFDSVLSSHKNAIHRTDMFIMIYLIKLGLTSEIYFQKYSKFHFHTKKK